MASTLKVQNIAHTGGTTGISIDTTGIVTHPLKSILEFLDMDKVQYNQIKHLLQLHDFHRRKYCFI